jgi:micrococcal nuclease
LLLGALALILAETSAGAERHCREPELVRVHDGDTLSLRCDGRLMKLRLASIDAPEYRQPSGRAARAALAAALEGRRFSVRTSAADRYGRQIGEVLVDGELVSLRLVSEGWAWCGPRTAKACRQRQDAAKAARRGLWADPDPQPPWRWRQQHPYKPADKP